VKRRGFTLIELMVVIAIIIILAAIAIPNYLKMTERAKKSRLASDYATLATVLETFKTDWGIYPIAGSAQDVSATGSRVYQELGGVETASNTNIAANTNAVGEHGPIQYIKTGTLLSIKNPFDAAGAPVYYVSTADGKAGWAIYANIGGTTANYLYRTSSTSTASESTTIPTAPAS
jgi:prepilin-type N-terminal cleavage/methylation domain-containing protein